MDKKTYNNLVVSSSPHIVTNMDTSRTMATVMIALVPSLLVSTWVFGVRVLLLTAVCIAASMFFEWAFNKLLKKRQTVGDLSAALTGMLIAFNVPSGLPIWIAVVGCFVAVIVAKQLFGGIGKNIVNPAITARIVLFLSFTTEMTTWPTPNPLHADAATGATPLGILAEGGGELPSNMMMFLGVIGGSMGEVSAIALLIGGLFLIWKKIISPIIPACFIGTVFVFSFIYYAATGDGSALNMAIFHVLAGGVMLGAFFMATDYVTTPLLPMGKVIFGVGCGLLTMIIRLWGQYPEGVSFSILIMNCLTPLIEDFCQKRMYGGAKKNEK
ncbi:MAG: RnfABCDGE type electron transport complex subunit D [Firmicutes bacterium]|nr:RnfABCDGE type electron transport complex subunit D [Bacillota bacterium]MDD7601399.1 RnfABCDGE type electron transport complex subunit D [Bacillota bacterium]MDY5857202.1 RnfABCDGE type electron transport complex subunit D [Anaerovoracaceae bacterium]